MPRDRHRDVKPHNVIDLPRVRAALAKLDALPRPKTPADRARLGAHLEHLENDMAPRPPKPDEERRSTHVGIRLTTAELERIERVSEAMKKALPAFDVSSSTTIRAAIDAGLDLLEARYGLKKKRRK